MSLNEIGREAHQSRRMLFEAVQEQLIPTRNQTAEVLEDLKKLTDSDEIGHERLRPAAEQLMGALSLMDEGLGNTSNYWQQIGRFLRQIGYSDSDTPEVHAGEDTALTFSGVTSAAAERPQPTPILAGGKQAHLLPPAPLLRDIAQDSSRNEPLLHHADWQDKVTATSEPKAAEELITILKNYIATGSQPKIQAAAEQILEHLNYIGNQELATACQAVSKDWRDYLEQNPAAQIWIVPGISRLETRLSSDALILEKVLEDMDMEAIKGRVVTNFDQVTAEPENTRVILLDDWILTGSQASTALARFATDDRVHPYIKQLEINLVTATKEMLQKGFMPWNSDMLHANSKIGPVKRLIPVKACFMTHESTLPRGLSFDQKPIHIHITGAHSTPKYSLEVVQSMLPDPPIGSGPAYEKKIEAVTPILTLENKLAYQRTYPRTAALYGEDSQPDTK